METRVAEVGDGIYQLMTYLAEMDFAVNQYLLTGDEPLLFHTGMRGLFPTRRRRGRQRDARSRRCGGSASATSRPTSAAR